MSDSPRGLCFLLPSSHWAGTSKQTSRYEMPLSKISDLKVVTLSEHDPELQYWRAHQANWEFYRQHADELWKTHDGKKLLIYDGGTVEAFDDHAQLVDRLEELDEHVRAAALHRWQLPQGTLLL